MAKISTYPADATPSLSDMVIGTDVNDANNTKNYSISSILGLANLTTTYVPYTGANNDVDLGNNNLSLSGSLLFPNSTSGIYFAGGTSFITGVVDFYSLNAQVSNYNVINKIDFIQPWTELQMQGNPGSAGNILMSNGSGVAPTWEDVSVLTSHGQFFSTLNPTFVANNPTVIQLNNTDTSTTSGVSIVLSTQITFSKTGQYKISYSCNLNVGASGNNHYMVLFLKKNGTTDVSNSTRRYLTTGNSYTIRVNGESLVDVTAGDYFQLMCAMTSNNLSLIYVPATLVAPIAPVEPSTIVTVTQI